MNGLIEYVEFEAHNTRDKKIDNSKARRDLGFETTVDLEEGIRRTIEWQRAIYLGVAPGSGRASRDEDCLVIQESDWVERNPIMHHRMLEALSRSGDEVRVIDFEIDWHAEGPAADPEEAIGDSRLFTRSTTTQP